MKLGFNVNGIEVIPEMDLRHINEHIETGHQDVKAYIENLEDSLDLAYRELLKYEPDNDFVLEHLELNNERNKRTRG